MTDRGNIVIVGGGIGGLALGVMLAKLDHGYRIIILDRRQKINPVFRPDILQPRGLQILDEMDVLDRLSHEPVHPCASFNFYKKNGDPLCRVDYRMLHHPYPYTLIAYPHITQRVLLEKLQEYKNVEVRWNTEVCRLLHEDGKVCGVYTLSKVEKESFIEAPIVIGADGKASIVRQLLGFRAQVHTYAESFISIHLPLPDDFGTSAKYYLGSGQILGLFPMSSTSLCALYMVPVCALSRLPLNNLIQFKETIEEIIPGAKGVLDSVFSLSRMGWFPCLRVHAEQWIAGGAALLGDAVHAFFPHVAQGSTQAMEDARVLTGVIDTCFQNGDFSAEALFPYEQARRPSVEKLHRLAADYEWLWNSPNPMVGWLRDRIFVNIGQNNRLMYKTIANEAGLQIEPLTWWERGQAVMGVGSG